MKDIDIYAPAEKAIQTMNRDMIRDFGKLKLAKFDELHLIRTVTEVYRQQAKKAEQRFYEVGFEAYLLGLYLCGIEGLKAHRMAEKAITPEWVRAQLEETNLVTLYRFDTETERKAQRLTETLAAAAEVLEQNGSISGGGGKPNATAVGPDAEIDRAVRAWSKQVGQYALGITDAAVMEAYDDAEVEKAQWVSEKDNRVCTECHRLDGRIFLLSEVPVKPHWGCRCRVIPVRGT